MISIGGQVIEDLDWDLSVSTIIVATYNMVQDQSHLAVVSAIGIIVGVIITIRSMAHSITRSSIIIVLMIAVNHIVIIAGNRSIHRFAHVIHRVHTRITQNRNLMI